MQWQTLFKSVSVDSLSNTVSNIENLRLKSYVIKLINRRVNSDNVILLGNII